MKIQTMIPIEISLDALREKIFQMGDTSDFEFKAGLYCVIDADSIGIKSDISRLINKDVFSPKEEEAVIKKLNDEKLNQAERKALQRAMPKLKACFSN